MINSRAPISCIMVQITSTPTDPIVRANFPIGSRIVIPKKKWPYFTKFGKLKMKKLDMEFTLYIDEVEFIVEKKIETQTQRHINYLNKKKDKKLIYKEKEYSDI
jgi:hypothetical protein